MYTAAVILKLHEQGKLDLDETIATYLPASTIDGIHCYKGKDYSRQIRLYQLVNQTSGLPDYELDKAKGGQSVIDQLKRGYDLALDNQQILALVRNMPPLFEPGAGNGTKAHYASTNYRLLGDIIASVTGRSAEESFEQMIFAPLDLQHTYVYPMDTTELPAKPAAVYFKDRVAVIPKYLASNLTDGSIISTVCESLTFLRAFFEGHLFDPKFFERMTQRWNRIFFPLQYGYGMMRLNLPRIFSPFRPFPEYIGHSGTTGSFAYYCRDKEIYLAGSVNQVADPSRPIRLMMQLADLVES
jgi:CubicO group peptidase (beta-lactamase class C family)